MYFYLLYNNCMCKRRQSEVTMVLAIIQKEKQQPTNYKIIGTNYLQQSFEEQNSFVLEKKILAR